MNGRPPRFTRYDTLFPYTTRLRPVYTARYPDRCATLSPVVINDIIRRRIGFDGLLMSDDLGMHALKGSFAERAQGVLDAGCDIVLHCSGDLAEMEEVAGAVTSISPRASDRLERAMAVATRVARLEFGDSVAKWRLEEHK